MSEALDQLRRAWRAFIESVWGDRWNLITYVIALCVVVVMVAILTWRL